MLTISNTQYSESVHIFSPIHFEVCSHPVSIYHPDYQTHTNTVARAAHQHIAYWIINSILSERFVCISKFLLNLK